MKLSPGSMLGHYEITRPLGAGGMGEVYGARDTRLGREVAVKVLPRELAGDPERLARFEREAVSASALNHPSIVTIHDFATRDGEAYLVMELVRGESLREHIARGPFPVKKLLAVGAAVADGLAAAHAAGIVHRDLKPENVMVAGDGAAKILDFGLVKSSVTKGEAADSPTDLQVSRAGVVLGTPLYMSPEQARGEAIDFRSDQFSLGLMLYEMATGKHPLRRATPFETLTAILNDDPEPLPAALPEPFTWIVERCLAKSAADRYESTRDLARDLVRLRDHQASGGLRPQDRPGRRSRGWPVLPALAAALAAMLAAGYWMGRPDRAPAAAPLQVEVATAEMSDVRLGEVASPVVISPDGRHLILYGKGLGGNEGLWLHDLRSGASRRIAENAFGVVFAPDSRAIAYFADGKLKIAALDGGPPRIVCDARPEGTPTWHGDTILFAQYSTNPGIFRVSAAGGVPEQVVGTSPGSPVIPWWPQFLPDGKRFLHLALVQPPEGSEISHELRVGSLDGAAPRGIAAISSRAVFADGHLLFVRDGVLLAQPFDPDALRLLGEAQPVVDDLHYFRSTGLAAFGVSENGLLVWRSAAPPGRLVWLDRAGLEEESIGEFTFPPGSGANQGGGRLSRDGTRYALGIRDPRLGVADVWIYNLTRGNAERLTFQTLDEKHPVWSPDGTIYYRSDGGGGPPDIFKLTPGSERRTLVHRGPGVNEPHDVSPDGKSLLFIDYNQTGGGDIKVLPLAPPGQPRAFAATPFQELSPRFSPDGRWVAYSSDVSGRPEVYVRPFAGNAPPVRISKNGGTRPRWRPDGTELYFLDTAGRLMAVAAAAEFGTPSMLFQAADAIDYEVGRDGKRFLVQLEHPSKVPPVHLLVNWQARLRPQR